MKIKFILLSIYLLLFFSCSKELDISEFSDDFVGYESELRIEAIILSTKNTAIVRIDRSFQLNDDLPYNCEDDNGNWNPLEDDVGTDGIDSIEEGIPVDSDGSEGNGQPDCGEPHVDEYEEILSQIHVQGCDVQITHTNVQNIATNCILEFNETADSLFYTDSKHSYAATMENIETAYYGAYVPSDACDSFNWQDYDSEYTLSISCADFPEYGSIISKEPIQISTPVVYYNNIDHELMKNCDSYKCLQETSTISDTVYFAEHAPDQYIHYASLLESSYYQAVQYHLDKTSGEYKITHEHADQATDIENIWGNICLMTEKVVTRIFDGNDDDIDEADISKYELFTFNESFINYYFFDMLDIRDPVRTNLRDKDENPIMGTFGALASNEIILRIIDCKKFESIEECNNNSHQVCEWNMNISKCVIKNSGSSQD